MEISILGIGTDHRILDKNSSVSARFRLYGNEVKAYHVVVPAKKDVQMQLSDNVYAYGVGGSNKVVQWVRMRAKCARICKEQSINVITVRDFSYLAYMAFTLARKFSTGLEIQIHGIERLSGMRKAFASFVLPKADSIRAVSERMKTLLVKQFGVQENHVSVVPIFVDKERFSVSNHTETQKPFVFLAVGRLVAIKRFDMLIDAFVEMHKGNQNIRLHIVGAGSEEEKLKQHVQKNGLDEVISFVGEQQDMISWYKKSDCLVLPSDAEGWGLVAIEAAASGLPVIMTDTGCAGEAIEHEKQGLIIPVGDRNALVEAMKRITDDTDLRTTITEQTETFRAQMLSEKETIARYRASWEYAMK